MGIYQINIYDHNWHLINQDYKRCSDRQQAEITAETDCSWLGGEHYEVTRIR